MKISNIKRSRVVSAMVRGYFHAFFSGQADAIFPQKSRLEACVYKKLLVASFDKLATNFVSVLFPILVRLNYSDIDAVTEDMRRRHFSEATPSKILLRYACKTKELYEFVTSEYQKQVYELLNGHLQSVEDFFDDCPTLLADDSIPVPLAIRSIVRVQMQAYALGITQAQTEINNLRQTTIYRLMLSGMVTLLHETPVNFSDDNLEMMFRQVSLNSDNFESLMNEMNQAYEDLV